MVERDRPEAVSYTHLDVYKRQDGEALGLVVRQAQVVLARDQIVLDLLQVLDGGVDLIDGRLELAARCV